MAVASVWPWQQAPSLGTETRTLTSISSCLRAASRSKSMGGAASLLARWRPSPSSPTLRLTGNRALEAQEFIEVLRNVTVLQSGRIFSCRHEKIPPVVLPPEPIARLIHLLMAGNPPPGRQPTVPGPTCL